MTANLDNLVFTASFLVLLEVLQTDTVFFVLTFSFSQDGLKICVVLLEARLQRMLKTISGLQASDIFPG